MPSTDPRISTSTIRRATPADAAATTDPHAAEALHGRRLTLLALLVSAQFVVMLDTSIVNVALPSIQGDLALGTAALTWVVNAYVLTFGGLLLLSGRATDLVGRRGMFTGGAALFTIGTVLAAGATDGGWLVAGRVVQGVGAAALSPAAMSLLLKSYPGPARAKAMSAWGAASTLGGATGVLAGGLLAGTFGWSSVFLVTVPISLAAAVLGNRLLPRDHGNRGGRFDLLGAATITAAVVSLVHGALAAARSWTAPDTLGAFACAAALFAAFLVLERRAVEPLVPLHLFSSRVLSTGVGLAVLGGAARASTFVLVALFLQRGLAMAPQQAGLAMVPTSLTGFAVSLALLPRVLRAIGPRFTLVAGLLVLAAGHLWLGHASNHAGYLVAVLPGLFLVAVGVALSFTPTTMVIASATPDDHVGLASGLAGSATQVGAAVGTAAFTAVALSGGGSSDALASGSFPAAFTAAAAVAVATAVLGLTIVRERRTVSPEARFR